MSLKKLISVTYKMNLDIYINNLSLLNFGNASSFDRKKNLVFIKASGISRDTLFKRNIVYGNINDDYSFKKNKACKFIESVDTVMHNYLYKNLENINHIVHTHSTFATVCAQLNLEPHNFGTTHADFFFDKIPISKQIKKVNKNYEIQLGESVVAVVKKKKFFPPGILLNNHGVLSWGYNPKEAIDRAIAIELICKFFYLSYLVRKRPKISNSLKKFHYLRKNGKFSYYGQK